VSAQRSSYYHRPYLRIPDKMSRSLVTEYIVQTPKAARAYPSRNTSVIPNAIHSPTQRNREQARALLRLKPNDVGITCVSNLRPGKGHAILLRALAQLDPEPEWRAFIVGDGPEQNKLERMIINLGLSHRVRLLGKRRDVGHILAGSDIFIFPSRAEGMSNALLEALAAGLPVVASNISANKAVITHNENGLLAADGRAGDFATHVSSLLAKPTERKRLAQAAQVRAQEQHSIELITSKWREVLQRIVS